MSDNQTCRHRWREVSLSKPRREGRDTVQDRTDKCARCGATRTSKVYPDLLGDIFNTNHTRDRGR